MQGLKTGTIPIEVRLDGLHHSPYLSYLLDHR